MTVPTVQVLLDNFLGAFPFDITQYVRMSDGFQFSRGRPDEFSQASSGALSMTLDNTDGRFTLGSATYSIGLDQQIRIKVNGVNKWTGFVQAWPVAWPSGGQEFSTVQITAVDAFANMARRTLRSAVEEDILRDNPVATYPLSEAKGATLAGDKSGLGTQSLAITGTGTALVFGSGTGPTDGLTCVQFNGGTFLRNAIPAVYVPAGSAFSLECYFASTLIPSFTSFVVSVGSSTSGLTPEVLIGITPTGKLAGLAPGAVLTSAASVNDGLVHHAMLTLTSGGTATLYLDGVNVGTSAGASTPANDLTVFSVAQSDLAGISTPYVGTLAHPSVYSSAVGSAHIGTRDDAANDYVAETPAARIARVASYCGTVTTALDTAGNTIMGASAQTGRNALDVINEVADATLGFVFVNGSGQVTSQNGYTVVGDVTADATLDALYADPGTAVQADMALVINEATGGSTSSENVFTAGNAFSQGVHGVYHQDYTWNVSTDAQAVDRTNWIVNTYAGPDTRFPSLTFDVLSMDASATTQAMNLDITAFLHMTGMPSQVSGIADLIVQGAQWTISATQFAVEVNCTKHINYAAWILQDATWGTLGSTTKLYGA